MPAIKVDKQRWTRILLHFIVICMVFILPDMLFSYANPRWKVFGHHAMTVYLKAAVYIAVFYIEYIFIIPLTLQSRRKHRVLLFILFNLLLVVATLAALSLVQHYMYHGHHFGHHHHGHGPAPTRWQMVVGGVSFVVRDIALSILVIGLAAAMRLGEGWSALQSKHDKLLASQQAEELASLKSQLNPHFLFNTLNTIYALVDIDPKEAQRAVHELSALLRYMLYENPASVKLSKEVDFAKNYVALMEMRLGEGAVKTVFDLQSDPDVAPLIFVSLIENAFKHGNTGRKNEPIEISITADGRGAVRCRTSNHFLPKEADAGAKQGGIGLANLRRRLLLLYGSRASLSTEVRGDVFVADLTINP